MKLSLIVAMDQNGVIGRGGVLPWHLAADLARFKKLTMGHTLVMGRKTYESIGCPLPGRTSIVMTRQKNYQPPGVEVASDLSEALSRNLAKDDVFIIGGGDIYRQALSQVDRVYLTRVHAQVGGDVSFSFNITDWLLVEDIFREADEKNRFPLNFQVYERMPFSPHRLPIDNDPRGTY